jgi:phosphate-selective porin OprO/OprP
MRIALSAVATAALLASVTTMPVLADGWSFDMNPGPRWDDPNSSNYFKLRGRAYFDYADIDWMSPLSGAPSDDTEWRTARLGIEGRFGIVKYVAEFDFSGDDVVTKDISATISLPEGSLRIGQGKTVTSMEELTSSRYVTFMERGLATDLFGLDRRMGVAYYWNNGSVTASAGIYGAPLDNNFAFREANDSSAVAARVTWSTRPDDETVYHLGGSVRGLDYGGAGTRLRVRPNAHLSNRFAAADFRAGSVMGEAESSFYTGLEAAVISGPLHVHGELARLSLDGPSGDPTFNSGFINAGYFLTGETRRYKSSSGTFDRTSPASPVSEGGMGAVEVATRYDFADMGDAGLGTISTWTVGVNWYVEKHLRVMANWVNGEHDGPGYVEEGDAIQFRVQADF